MAVATFQFDIAGANPFDVDRPVSNSGIPTPQIKLGQVTKGDNGAEFVYCSFSPAGATTLVDGSVFVIDKDFVASLVTTTNSPLGAPVGVGRVAASVAAGATVYLWLQIRGRANVLGSASAGANRLVETTATAGQVNAPASATTGAKRIERIIYMTSVGGSAGSAEANLQNPVVGATL